MIKPSLTPAILDIHQCSSRIMYMQLRATPNIHIIAAYMPQAFGKTWEKTAVVYDDFNKFMDTIPKSQPLYIGGDFNVRIHHRPADEQAHIGPHVNGRGEQYANSTCQQHKKNKELFLAWINSNEFYVSNTWLQEPHKQLIKYREVGTHPGESPDDTSKNG